jgi:hypothetical protein
MFYSFKFVNITKFVVDVCAEMVHIMWISQHYRIVNVLKNNMKIIEVNTMHLI